MNILFAYSKTKGTLAEYYIKSLKKKGHHIETFDLLQAPRWITKGRISIPTGKNISIQKVIRQCQRKPDLVIEVDGATRHLSGYEKLNVPTAFYAIDTHLVFNFHRNIINNFDYVFIAQKDYLPLLKRVKNDVFWLPLAADQEIHRRYNVPKLFDIGFVGQINPKIHPIRTKLLNLLRERYNVLAVPGPGIYYENMAKVYSLSKIGFNKSIRGDLNMRVFEVMSSRTMLLTDKINNGINNLFVNKKHLVTYENEEELNELVQYYLENEEEREKIARIGQKEVHEKHTYEHRTEQILKTVKV